ncbi:MAG TPA: M28 family peptidase [Vicinamibacteria bacterium]|nr:M28 family peptidase [Vicinamibacteria bacterium]
MRLLIVGVLAAVTAAGLALIRPAVLTEEERTTALAIREQRMRADIRFLSGARLEGQEAAVGEDRLTRRYVASRFEAIGLEPMGGAWEQPFDIVGVVGLLRGRDAELAKEAVVYTARLRGRSANGDSTARVDGLEVSGRAALLAIAEAFAGARERPRRSVLFAAVAGERLGSEPLATQPPVARIVADLRLDVMNVRGRRSGVPVVSDGRTSIDDWFRAVAEAQGRTLLPEALPRARAGGQGRVASSPAGVPTVFIDPGRDGLGEPSDRPLADPSSWDLSGAVEDARLLFLVGTKVADAPLAPRWRSGGEVEAVERTTVARGR